MFIRLSKWLMVSLPEGSLFKGQRLVGKSRHCTWKGRFKLHAFEPQAASESSDGDRHALRFQLAACRSSLMACGRFSP
ncbi:hypothetical protein ACLUUI_17825 [Enterobacterales bacterium AW_CKDN230030176-1A_HGKHYDSX7]